MKVRIVAYKNRIVCVPSEPEKDIGNGWYPTGQGRLGCVITDTKKSLGISEEALKLMKSISPNRDAIGDISWWEVNDGTHAFAWWGSVHRVINPSTAEGDRDFKLTQTLRKACTIIPNDVPDEAKAVLDSEEDPHFWKEPHAFDSSEPEDEQD